MKEDLSWSSVSGDESSPTVKGRGATSNLLFSVAFGGQKSNKASIEGSLHKNPKQRTVKELEMELAKKDRIYEDVQRQLSDLQESKELAVNLLQATLQTETFLDKLEECTGQDILDTISALITGSENLKVGELKEKAVKFAKSVLEKKASFAVPVLAACDILESLKDTDLKELALTKIRSNPGLLCGEDSWALLTEHGMEAILADKTMEGTEYEMFCILQSWSKSCNEINEESRRDVASEFIKHIDLANIDPTLLCSEVRESNLVSDAQLVDAFSKQAPKAKGNLSFQKRHISIIPGVWKYSSSDIFVQTTRTSSWLSDAVTGRTMKRGAHKWKYRIENRGNATIFLGIAAASHKPQRNSNIGERGSACVGTDGYVYIDGSKYYMSTSLAALSTGSTVEFVLNFQVGNKITLTSKVNGGEVFSVFENRTIHGCESGFFPAASLYGDISSVRFLGFEG